MNIKKIIKTIKGRTLGILNDAGGNTKKYVNCLQVFNNVPSNIKKVKFTFFPIELNTPLEISIQKANDSEGLKYSLIYSANKEPISLVYNFKTYVRNSTYDCKWNGENYYGWHCSENNTTYFTKTIYPGPTTTIYYTDQNNGKSAGSKVSSVSYNSNTPIHYNVTISRNRQFIFTADNEDEISNYLTTFFTDKNYNSFYITKGSLDTVLFFRLLSLIQFIL